MNKQLSGVRKEINKVLSEFFENEGFEVEVDMAQDFEYFYATSMIHYSLITSDRLNKLFFKFAKANGLKYDCGDFMLSLFHELGHHETLDEIETDYTDEKDKLNANNEDDCYKYYMFEDEFMATIWAIDYINHNKSKIKKLAEQIQNILIKWEII